MDYINFLKDKIITAEETGFEVNDSDLPEILKPHQRDAVKMGRYGIGVELNSDYFRDGAGYLKMAEQEATAPTLFDFLCEGIA